MKIHNQTKIVLIAEMQLKREAMQIAFNNNTTLSDVIRKYLYAYTNKSSNIQA